VLEVVWPTNSIDVVPASSGLFVAMQLVKVVLVFIPEGSKLDLKRVRLPRHGVDFSVKLLTDLTPQQLVGAGLLTNILTQKFEPCCQEELDLVD
jgi:hypothetical protein